MAYTIQAVIARAGSFGKALPSHFRIVPLAWGIEMVPFSDDVLEFYGIPAVPLVQEDAYRVSEDADGKLVEIAPPELLELCRTLSAHGDMAYIEAEFFGGVGSQAQVMFANGKQAGAQGRTADQ